MFADRQLLLNLSNTNYIHFDLKLNADLRFPTLNLEGVEIDKVDSDQIYWTGHRLLIKVGFHIDRVATKMSLTLFTSYRL